MGYGFEKRISLGDCVKYEKRVDEDNNVKIVALPELQCIIAGLTSEVPYEFRISAVNEIGEGVVSDPSGPIWLPNAASVSLFRVPLNFHKILLHLVDFQAPAMPALVNFKDLTTLREGREVTSMAQSDWNVAVNGGSIFSSS